MNKSYLAMVEYSDETIKKFFTGKAKGRSEAAFAKANQIAKEEASEWASATICEKGTQNVRVTLCEVISCIVG